MFSWGLGRVGQEVWILTLATRNGAEALGLLDDVWTIESGKRADLFVLRANPSLDIRNTQEIEFVFQAGIAMTFRDPDHSFGEQRLTFGIFPVERLLIVSHTGVPGKERILGIWKARRHERKIYQDG